MICLRRKRVRETARIEISWAQWTGFVRPPLRNNVENNRNNNDLDALEIRPERRDPFPKADLKGGYIGDRYPLTLEDLSSIGMTSGKVAGGFVRFLREVWRLEKSAVAMKFWPDIRATLYRL